MSLSTGDTEATPATGATAASSNNAAGARPPYCSSIQPNTPYQIAAELNVTVQVIEDYKNWLHDSVAA